MKDLVNKLLVEMFEHFLRKGQKDHKESFLRNLQNCLSHKNNKVQLLGISLVVDMLRDYGLRAMDNMKQFLDKSEVL